MDLVVMGWCVLRVMKICKMECFVLLEQDHYDNHHHGKEEMLFEIYCIYDIIDVLQSFQRNQAFKTWEDQVKVSGWRMWQDDAFERVWYCFVVELKRVSWEVQESWKPIQAVWSRRVREVRGERIEAKMKWWCLGFFFIQRMGSHFWQKFIPRSNSLNPCHQP